MKTYIIRQTDRTINGKKCLQFPKFLSKSDTWSQLPTGAKEFSEVEGNNKILTLSNNFSYKLQELK